VRTSSLQKSDSFSVVWRTTDMDTWPSTAGGAKSSQHAVDVRDVAFAEQLRHPHTRLRIPCRSQGTPGSLPESGAGPCATRCAGGVWQATRLAGIPPRGRIALNRVAICKHVSRHSPGGWARRVEGRHRAFSSRSQAT
jgi:hypothetical protein